VLSLCGTVLQYLDDQAKKVLGKGVTTLRLNQEDVLELKVMAGWVADTMR